MAAGTASRYVVAPGRTEEFVTAVRGASGVLTPLGATVGLRRMQVSGENSGQLSLTIVFEDERTRAVVLERVRTENLLASFAEAVQGADPPAQPVSRAWLNEVGGPGGVPQMSPVLSVVTVRPVPGHSDAALKALADAQRKHTGLGVQGRVWRVVVGGPMTGAYLYGTPHASLPALQDFREANMSTGRLPISEAIEAGVLAPFGASIGFTIDL